MNRMSRISISLISLFLSFSVFAKESPVVENWKVVIDNDPVSKSSECLLESTTHVIEDGQTRTPVKLVYSDSAIYAVTKSHIDLSYPNLGLKVDTDPAHKIERLHKENTAVFANNSKLIHKQFTAGRTAILSLGFWPTWPKTTTRVIEFDLIGYTKAYRQLKKCQKNGKLP